MNDTAAPAAKPRKATTLKSSATKAVRATGSSARDLAERTAAGIEANPLSVLVGGVALGVLAGAFVPRTEREEQLLGPLGKRLTDTARGAADAARDTAKSELDVLGLTRDAMRNQAGKVIEGLITTLTTAGAAALTSAKAKPAPTE